MHKPDKLYDVISSCKSSEKCLAKLCRLILIITLFLTGITVMAEEMISVTPVEKFTTCSKTLSEGDTVKFKTTAQTRKIKKGEVITGTILFYEENGFHGKEAKIKIGNFVTENGKYIKGNLYLSGGDHPVFTQFLERYYIKYLIMTRGGEIMLVPDKDVVTFFTE